MKKILFLVVALLAGSTGWGQGVFSKYAPVAGIQKSTGLDYHNTAAAASDVTPLFGCGGSSTLFLRGDGSCVAPAGTGVSSVSVSVPLTASSCSGGACSITWTTGQTANRVLATPDGTTGAVSLRALVAGDVPPIALGSTANGGVASASILLGTNGGTSNAFFSVTGPTTALRTFTFPNASATVLTTNAAVTVPQGGTGLATLTAHGVLLGEGTSNLGNVAAMAADTLLQGQGVTADPAAVAINNCGSPTTALSYSTSTHTFGCQTITAGGTGTVTSITGGTGITASPNPIISTGTLTVDQAFSPTWTGVQTFSQTQGATRFIVSGPNTGVGWGVVFADTTNSVNRGFIGIGTSTVAGAAVTDFAISPGPSGSVVIGTANGGAIGTRFGPSGNVTINTPSSGVAETVNAGSGAVALQSVGNGTALNAVFNGGNLSTGNIESSDSGRTNKYTFGRDNASTGNWVLAFNGTELQHVTSAGNVVIDAPSSGTTVALTSGSGVGTALSFAWAGATPKTGYLYSDATYMGLIDSANVAGAFDGFLENVASGTVALYTSGNARISVASAGNITVSAPSSGTTTTTTAVAGGVAESFVGPNTGTGFNVNFLDSTNSAFRGFIGIGTSTVVGAAVTDFAISPGVSGSVVIGTANGAAIGTRFSSDGGVVVGAATGGDKGVGTVNATALYINGAAVGVGGVKFAAGTLTTSGGGCTINQNTSSSLGGCTRTGTGVAQVTATGYSSGSCVVASASSSYIAIAVGAMSGNTQVVNINTPGGVAIDGQFSIACIGN